MFAVPKMVARRGLIRNAVLMAVLLPTLVVAACAPPPPPPPAPARYARRRRRRRSARPAADRSRGDRPVAAGGGAGRLPDRLSVPSWCAQVAPRGGTTQGSPGR